MKLPGEYMRGINVIVLLLILTGCENRPVIEKNICDDNYVSESKYSISMVNNTGKKLYSSLISRVFTERGDARYNIGGANFDNMDEDNAINERYGFFTSLISDCDGLGYPPDDGMVYHIWLFTIVGNSEKKHFVVVGGSKEDYEAFIPKNDKYPIPENTEVVAYNLAFIPGRQLRQELGLKVNNPENTEIYTYLDLKKRAYSGSLSFHLTITINGTTADDFSFDYSGDFYDAESTSTSKVENLTIDMGISGASGH